MRARNVSLAARHVRDNVVLGGRRAIRAAGERQSRLWIELLHMRSDKDRAAISLRYRIMCGRRREPGLAEVHQAKRQRDHRHQ